MPLEMPGAYPPSPKLGPDTSAGATALVPVTPAGVSLPSSSSAPIGPMGRSTTSTRPAPRDPMLIHYAELARIQASLEEIPNDESPPRRRAGDMVAKLLGAVALYAVTPHDDGPRESASQIAIHFTAGFVACLLAAALAERLMAACAPARAGDLADRTEEDREAEPPPAT